MSELAFQVAAGLNNTVAQVLSVLRVLLSASAAVLLDSDGRVSVAQVKEAVNTSWGHLLWWLELTDLQSHVLKALVIVLVVNLVLITVAWHVYAHRISHTLSFNSLRIVEDILKKNTNFKVPKEHTPRL